MSKYKYNVTVEVDDEDDKYNEMTIRLGIKNAIQRHLRFASLHNNSNVKIERDFSIKLWVTKIYM